MYQLRKKKLADSVAIYGQGRDRYRPPTYSNVVTRSHNISWFETSHSLYLDQT